MNADNVAERIRDALRCGRPGCDCRRPTGNVHCPSHDDPGPSLHVTGTDGRVLWRCFGGCEQGAVRDALVERGLWPPTGETVRQNGHGGTPGTLPKGRPAPCPPRERRWSSVDPETGKVVATHVRVDLAPDPETGKKRKRVWWEPKGVQPATLPLCGWEALAAADHAVVVEGEPTADAANALLAGAGGVVAVGTVTGAGDTPGDPVLAPLLDVPRVTFLTDSDRPGRDHAHRTVSALIRLGHRDARLLDAFPGATGGESADDLLARGTTTAAFMALLETAAPVQAGTDRNLGNADNGGNASHEYGDSRQLAVAEGVTGGAGPVTVSGTRPRIWTAPELLAATFPEPIWAVRGLLPTGLAVLAGRPKKGKSWLALGIALAVARGTPALGHFPTGRGRPVLYLALEDTERRLQDRLRSLLGPEGTAPPSLHAVTSWPRLGEGFEEALRAWLTEHRTAALVIVDTVQRVKPPTARREDAYATDYAAGGAIKAIADEFATAALGLHHTRKPGGSSGGDPFDEILGSTGMVGAMDTGLVLTSEVGKADARLYLRGRDVEEAEHALSLHPDSGVWTRIGEAAEVRRSPERTAILGAVGAAGDAGTTPKEIGAATGQKDGNVRSLLFKMRNAAEVVEFAGRYYLPGKQPNPVAGDGGPVTRPVTLVGSENPGESTTVTGVTAVTEGCADAADRFPPGRYADVVGPEKESTRRNTATDRPAAAEDAP